MKASAAQIRGAALVKLAGMRRLPDAELGAAARRVIEEAEAAIQGAREAERARHAEFERQRAATRQPTC